MEVKNQFALEQSRIFLAYAQYYATRIQSKVYLNRLGKVKQATGVEFTEQEILNDEIQTMHRHIRNAHDCVECAFLRVIHNDLLC